MFCPVTESAKIALMAASPANAKRPKTIEERATSQTPLIGVFVYLLTRAMAEENGSAPSRAKAKVWRDDARSCWKKGIQDIFDG